MTAPPPLPPCRTLTLTHTHAHTHALAQSTFAGFGTVTGEHVFRVCDQPHPRRVEAMLKACQAGRVSEALKEMDSLWALGYSALDLVTTVFKVVKAQDMPEAQKLDMVQVISGVHMRVADGVATALQMHGMVCKLCDVVGRARV
jgi:replication factor C subunit 2/4